MKVLKKIAGNTGLYISKLYFEKKNSHYQRKKPERIHYQQTFTKGDSEEYTIEKKEDVEAWEMVRKKNL